VRRLSSLNSCILKIFRKERKFRSQLSSRSILMCLRFLSPDDEDPKQAVMQKDRQDPSIAHTYKDLPWIRYALFMSFLSNQY
jgi:hypothetical protein